MDIMLARAKQMRSNMTAAENVLWKHLRRNNLGVKVKRQQPLGHYIVDFVCFEHRIIIEADGNHHAGSEYDKIRDAWLESQGFRVMRFWNYEILENLEGVLEKIQMAMLE
jgi:very-short-patch-repair endonuclease